MRLFIDLDQHAAVQDFTVSAPAPPPQFKSQDTIDFLIYFLQAGVVQDMGAGFALKFAMIKTGDPANTILAYQTASSYLTDPNGNVYYQMQVVFNTSQMASAIGANPSIPCTIELRYQDALAEIIHTLNLAATVFQTIIVETGVTPPGVSTGYPDASTIELLVHKNVASGYAGLDATSHLNGAVIPMDGQTIALNGSGQVSSAAILAYTAANFTTPASGGTVSVTFVSTTNLKASSYVRIPIAGYYIVNSVTDSTHAVLQNNGDPFNALSGTTITSGAVVLPAQAAAGGGGTAGQNAYTTLSAGFTVPTVGATVSINVASTAWMPGSGYALFIGGAGYYLINSITDATHVVATNSGSAANQSPGTNVSSGGTVVGAGPQGAPGAMGASLSAYDALAASFIMPAVSGTVMITISNTAWIGANQILYIASAGYVQVATILNATMLTVTNLNYAGNATAGTTIASGSKVSPGGLQGPQGAGGAGLNAFTTLSANFTQPVVGANVTINVGTTAWMAQGQGIFVQGGGYYNVASISDLTHAVVTNLGGASNVAAGSTVTGSGTQTVAPAGLPGTSGASAYTVTTANFSQPSAGSNVTVSFGSTGWMAQNQNIFINGGGYYQVVTIASPTSATIQNLGVPGNVVSGSTIVSGAAVATSGATGLTGAPGPAGPSGGIGEAPTDGQIYGRQSSAWTPVTGGGGGSFDPANGFYYYDDFLYVGATADDIHYNSQGSGATFTGNPTYGQANAALKILGAIELDTGTSNVANQGITYYWGANFGTGVWPVLYGLGALTWKTRVFFESALPGTGISYAARFGLWQIKSANYQYNTNLPIQGFFFEYDPGQNGGQWRVGYVTSGAITYANSTSSVAADTAYDLEIDLNAAWTSLVFKINGTTVATITSGFPTTGVYGGPVWMLTRGAGSAVNYAVAIDSWMINYVFSR